jgi:60 kDa SS-A/Ro ribonucleoprotein
LIHGIEAAKKAENEKSIISIINEYKLPWEAIPTEFLGSSEVWSELLPNLPMTALLRNLGRLTSNGTLKPLSKQSSFVCDKLTNNEFIKKARIHPLSVLVALKTYESGKGLKGNLSWSPIATVSDALDEMYYKAFNYVEPTGKNILIGVDVSGSMSWGNIAGMPITPCVGAAAMAMTIARTEKNYHIMGFTNQFFDLGISVKDSLKSAIRKTQRHNFGGTDCALPMQWALKNDVDVDAFVVITDNETWAGGEHPVQSLKKYRNKYGKGKLIVIGMTSNGFSIADPSDGGMMDLVGFDTACPQIISDFIRQ